MNIIFMQLVREDPDHKAKITDERPRSQMPHPGRGMADRAKVGLKERFAKLTGKPAEAAPELMMHEEATKVRIHKDAVQAAFRSTFLEDFGVLAYLLALIAVLVVSWMGSDWMLKAPANSCDLAKATATLGMAFFVVAFIYTLSYYCCSCCLATVEMNKEDIGGARLNPVLARSRVPLNAGCAQSAGGPPLTFRFRPLMHRRKSADGSSTSEAARVRISGCSVQEECD